MIERKNIVANYLNNARLGNDFDWASFDSNANIDALVGINRILMYEDKDEHSALIKEVINQLQNEAAELHADIVVSS